MHLFQRKREKRRTFASYFSLPASFIFHWQLGRPFQALLFPQDIHTGDRCKCTKDTRSLMQTLSHWWISFQIVLETWLLIRRRVGTQTLESSPDNVEEWYRNWSTVSQIYEDNELHEMDVSAATCITLSEERKDIEMKIERFLHASHDFRQDFISDHEIEM